jgi:EmrB/QacA subfamily drug resistance transporter
MLTLALAALEGTIVATAVPQIVGDLGGFSLFGWVFSAYLLTQTVTIPVYGKLADLYGRKPVLLVGIGIFLLGAALAASAWSMLALIVFRAIQGVGAGAIQATVQTVAGDLYPIAQRGRIQARLASVWGISAVLGPLAGGVLTETLSWRWIFVMNVPVGLLAGLLLWRHLHEDVQRRSHRIDVPGTVLILLSAGALVFGLLQGGVAWDWDSRPSILVFAVFVLAGLATVAVERRASDPVMPLWLWSRRALVGPNLAMIGLGMLIIGPTTFLPLYGQTVLGLGTISAGFVLATILISWPIAAALCNRLYLRIGFRRTGMIGAAVAFAGTAAFVVLPEHPPVAAVVGSSLVLGAGCGLLSVPMVVAVQATQGWEGRGVVTSTVMFSRLLGQSIGAGLFGAIVNTTLHHRLSTAPADIRTGLPGDLDGISRALEGGGTFDARSVEYLSGAMSAAVTHVYVGLAAVAALVLLVLATVMPKRQPLSERDATADGPDPSRSDGGAPPVAETAVL